ncbi:MAG: CoB--CoM heterodisulfide reductase iron-sulfur subunit B family protein [Pelotomaculaceae bacterium]|jgi:heterodisulfide reductase subunit B
MDVAYYPGCSAHKIAREYDQSARLVCRQLDLNLHEIDDWNCCGASAAHSFNRLLAASLGARNLALASQMNTGWVTSPCPACFAALKTASLELKENKELRGAFAAGGTRSHEIKVTHLLQLLTEEIGLDIIASGVKHRLSGLKLAAYYGCLTRPARIIEFDDPEQPVSLDLLLEGLGAQTVIWSHKAECCGGALAQARTDIVLDLCGEILEAARQAGASAIVAACPLCQINLDTRQQDILTSNGTKYNLPVIYFTQLMGLAFGFSPRAMGFNRLLTDPFPLLQTLDL